MNMVLLMAEQGDSERKESYFVVKYRRCRRRTLDGRNHAPVADYLLPMKQTAFLTGMNYIDPISAMEWLILKE